MSKFNAISDYLSGRKAHFITGFRIDEGAKTLVLEIPLEMISEKAGKGFTSKRQLAHLGRALSNQFGFKVITAIRQSQQFLDLESGLRALLTIRLRDGVSDVYISYPQKDAAHVWVFLKHEIQEGEIQDVKTQAQSFIQDANMSLDGIEFINADINLPSVAAILRGLKILSPATLDQIKEYLIKKGFYVPDERWLSSKLDYARKKRFLTRESKGVYILTSDGIEVVPHSRSKSSSDIERMLLLSRRRKW